MSEPTDAQAFLITSLLGLGCCAVSVIGLALIAIWLVRRRGEGASASTPGPLALAPAAPPVTSAAPFHLSVVALAFDASLRAGVQAALEAPSEVADAVAHRVEVVQRLTRALLGLEPHWQLFGYGEKDLVDLTGAQTSYSLALEDFRARTRRPGDAGALTVVTLVLCTRGQRLGVDRLDTRAQVHELLQDRLKVDVQSLLGAELVWDPPSGGLAEPTARLRYPEMHPLTA